MISFLNPLQILIFFLKTTLKLTNQDRKTQQKQHFKNFFLFTQVFFTLDQRPLFHLPVHFWAWHLWRRVGITEPIQPDESIVSLPVWQRTSLVCIAATTRKTTPNCTCCQRDVHVTSLLTCIQTTTNAFPTIRPLTNHPTRTLLHPTPYDRRGNLQSSILAQCVIHPLRGVVQSHHASNFSYLDTIVTACLRTSGPTSQHPFEAHAFSIALAQNDGIASAEILQLSGFVVRVEEFEGGGVRVIGGVSCCLLGFDGGEDLEGQQELEGLLLVSYESRHNK